MPLRDQIFRLLLTLLIYVLISGTQVGCSFDKLSIDHFKVDPRFPHPDRQTDGTAPSQADESPSAGKRF